MSLSVVVLSVLFAWRLVLGFCKFYLQPLSAGLLRQVHVPTRRRYRQCYLSMCCPFHAYYHAIVPEHTLLQLFATISLLGIGESMSLR